MIKSSSIKLIKTFSRIALALILSLTCLTGCTPLHDIELEKVHQTSNRLNCNKVFANSRKDIVELNEILVQTGSIDTVENAALIAAVIHVKGKELFLNQVSAVSQHGEFTETYAGKGYKLELRYQAETVNNSVTYWGTCQLWNGKLHTKFKVEGIINNL